MKKVRTRTIWTVACFMLATALYSSANHGVHLGVGVLYKHIFAAAIVLLSGFVFLVATNLSRARKLAGCAGMLMLPHLVILAISVPLWVTRFCTFEEIRGGLFSQLYQLNIILAMAGMAYMLGRASIWVNLAAMLTANAVTFVSTVHASGLSAYLRELWELITSFSDKAGPVISQMEIHELTFALGVYLVFFVLEWRELPGKPGKAILALLTVFFFLSGFKRIGVLAVVLAVLMGVFLRPLVGDRRYKWLGFAGLAAVAGMVAYVGLVDAGFLRYVEARWNINLMGRANLMALVERLYHFGPDFMGHGVGFLKEYIVGIRGTGLHNDIATMYIDIGFWGLILWGVTLFPMRARFLAKREGAHGAILSLCYGVYLVVTALTDNTLEYIYVTAAIAVLILADRLKEPAPLKTVEERAA